MTYLLTAGARLLLAVLATLAAALCWGRSREERRRLEDGFKPGGSRYWYTRE